MERDESERQPSWLEQQVAYLEAEGSGRLTMTVGSEEFALSQISSFVAEGTFEQL